MIALTACVTFDFAVFPAEQTDRYVLDYGVVPDELVEEVTFETSDGLTLYGSWARQDPPAPPMIFFHGYLGNLDTDYNAEWVEYYWTWGEYDVFTFDYRGYGRSEGEAGVELFERDGEAAVDYVVAESGALEEEIPWMSVSLGSAVAVHTNDERRAQVVVLDSLFANAQTVLVDSVGLGLPAGWFFEAPFDNVAAIPGLQDPALLIHGTADDFVAPENVLPLYAAAPNPKELWQPEGVGHANGYDVVPEEYRARVEAWIEAHP